MWKQLLPRLGVSGLTVVTTVFAVAVSVGIIALSLIFWSRPNPIASLVFAAITPLIIAPPLCVIWFRLMFKSYQLQTELGRTNRELTEALSQVKELSGLLPICSSCKRIRDDQGYWNQLEAYIQKNSKAEFTHGLCPDCIQKLYPELKVIEQS